MQHGYLILSSGEVHEGTLFGSTGTISAGEIVFNTSMAGYPEILTDPSYNGQMVLFTYPLVGNYGWDDTWSESDGVKVSALVVRRLYEGRVPEGRRTLDEAMAAAGIVGIQGVDTRRLTLDIRTHGSCNAVICPEDRLDEARRLLSTFPSITQRDLIGDVAVKKPVEDPDLGVGFASAPAGAAARIALVDFGIKRSIIENFYRLGVAVTLLPPTFRAEDVLDHEELAFVRAHVPETHVLDRTTDLAPYLAEPERWLARPAGAYRANEAVSGASCADRDDWWRVLLGCAEEGGVVQEIGRPYRSEVVLGAPAVGDTSDRGDEPVEVENLIGLFLFRGEFGGVYARGGYDGEIGPWSNRVTVGCLVARD